jgi:NAD(P)-dependent dehydrogenase (short-subunit alcohol dehydrogenase family)
MITAASRGIGRATALTFAREGSTAVVNYAQKEKDARRLFARFEK